MGTLGVGLSLPIAAAATPARGGHRSDVETRIRDLHQRLHITADQENLFNAVADVMRENASAMKALDDQHAAASKTANAIEQLQSYSAMVDAHDAGLHKFIPAFQSLYDSLSPAQKQAADALIRSRARAAVRRHGGAG